MSFQNFYKTQKLEERKVFNYKYTERIKNFNDLNKEISSLRIKDIKIDKIDSRTIEIFDDLDQYLGTIKDKGKSFEVDSSLFQIKDFQKNIEKII